MVRLADGAGSWDYLMAALLTEHWLLLVVGWLADHSPPFVAGFLGGLLSTVVRDRWKAR